MRGDSSLMHEIGVIHGRTRLRLVAAIPGRMEERPGAANMHHRLDGWGDMWLRIYSWSRHTDAHNGAVVGRSMTIFHSGSENGLHELSTRLSAIHS